VDYIATLKKYEAFSLAVLKNIALLPVCAASLTEAADVTHIRVTRDNQAYLSAIIRSTGVRPSGAGECTDC